MRQPVLESELEPLYECNTILRFIARKRKDKGFAGILPREEALIDQWLEYCANEIDTDVRSLTYPHLGMEEYDPEEENEAVEDLRVNLGHMESKLTGRNFLVGYGPTLADIVVSAALILPFGQLFGVYYKGEFPRIEEYLKEMSERFGFEFI